MKYGKTERISGIVILLALAAIIVPWLMSDPAPREEQPNPSFTIEQPVEVPRQDVAAPGPPASVSQSGADGESESRPESQDSEVIRTPPLESATGSSTDSRDAEEDGSQGDDATDNAADTATEAESDTAPEPAPEQKSDPIADLMNQAPSPAPQGEWAVQVGSFGQAENARRLKQELESEGFRVYTQKRDNNLTTVLAGPYKSSEDGERARTLIKQKANQQGLLIRIKD